MRELFLLQKSKINLKSGLVTFRFTRANLLNNSYFNSIKESLNTSATSVNNMTIHSKKNSTLLTLRQWRLILINSNLISKPVQEYSALILHAQNSSNIKDKEIEIFGTLEIID